MNTAKTSPLRRIAIFSAKYLPSMGGVERFTAELVRTLTERGHDVTVVTCEQDGPVTHELHRHHHYEIYRLPSRALLGGRFPLPLKDRTYRAIFDELAAKAFDGVLINTRFYPLSVDAARFAQSHGLTPVVLDHSSALLTTGNPVFDLPVHLWERGITERLKTFKPDFYGVSRKSSQWLATLGITSRGEIPNAIDTEGFLASAVMPKAVRTLCGDKKPFVAAFAGRLVKDKGFTLVCEAVRQLVAAGIDDIHLFVAGSGPDEALLQPSLGTHIHWLGRLAPDEVAGLLICADVFCLPSTYPEGFPTALLEAAAVSTLPLMTDTGGADELLAPYAFPCIIEPTVDSLIERLLYAHDYPEDAKRVADAIHAAVKTRYTWPATASKVEAALAEALEERKSQP